MSDNDFDDAGYDEYEYESFPDNDADLYYSLFFVKVFKSIKSLSP